MMIVPFSKSNRFDVATVRLQIEEGSENSGPDGGITLLENVRYHDRTITVQNVAKNLDYST